MLDVGGRLREPELLDAIAHLVAIDPEQLPGVRLIAASALERLNQQLPLDLLEVDALRRQAERRAASCCATACRSPPASAIAVR